LIDSHLFDLVKAVELIAGVGVLFGFYTPLLLLICMPVSFNVFYWDAPLEGWGSRAALFGYSTLFSNVLLCLAFNKSYRSMFALRVTASAKQQLVVAGRILFGAWMVLNGANALFLSLWPTPVGNEPLAIQLMDALVHSRLIDVAMAIQLVAGALILVGALVPAALCLLMPISVCALFWGVILDHQPLSAALALVAFAANGLLMLAYLRYYQGSLQRRALALGESPEAHGNFDGLFVNPTGRTPRSPYVAALITVAAAIAFFAYFVPGRTAQFCMLMLAYPASVLIARRLRDMGQSAWLALVAVLPILAAFAIKLGYASVGDAVGGSVAWIALAVSAALALWGCIGSGQPDTDRFGPAAASS
jgi:uncharacterized membrane protein YhaH (DUF805 family)